MYAKILVPLDGSALAEGALEQAAKIVKLSGAEVILVRVVESPLARIPEAGQSEEERSAREKAGVARDYLDVVALRLKAKGIERVRAEIMEGSPDAAILGLAHRENADLIVMSTHGHTGLARAIMGSVTEKVVYTTKRPVLLVKPERVAGQRSLAGDPLVKAG